MARQVLGTDPFAVPESIGVAAAASAPQPKRKTIPIEDGDGTKPTPTVTQKPRPAPRKRAPRQHVALKDVSREPAVDATLDAKLEAMEARLTDRIDERLDTRFGTLEAKLDAALERLTAAPAAAAADSGADQDVSEDDASDEEGAFVGFLDDAPRRGDDDSSESDTSYSEDGHARHRRPAPTLLGGLFNLFTPRSLGRRLGDARMRGRSDEVDEFGRDPVVFEQATQFFDWMYQKYWRVDAEGIENIPDEGRALIVGNHSGTLPFDGVMIATAARLHHPAEREVRALAEDMFSTLPFIAPLIARAGGVRACPENAERLLSRDELVAVFPEGVKGTGKYFRQRYNLQRFGRGGFIKICLRTNAPLIPVAVVGSEEIYPIIAKADWLGKPFGLPYTPITPTFPWLGPLGLIPLPTKWRIRFGEPMTFQEYGPDAIEDDILINHLKEDVRGRIQEMINDMLRERNSVFFG